VIVVIGNLLCRPGVAGSPATAAGRAAEVARSSVRTGANVQVVARLGDDDDGDAVLLALSRDGIGHAAVLRDPVRSTARVAPRKELDEATAAAVIEPDDLGAEPVEPLDPALRPTLEAADLELALRYLAEFRVLVLAEPLDAALRRVAFEAADFSRAHVVSVAVAEELESDGFPSQTLLVAPEHDPDNEFARLLGRYAAALDVGQQPAVAFATATQDTGWQAAVQA